VEEGKWLFCFLLLLYLLPTSVTITGGYQVERQTVKSILLLQLFVEIAE